MKNKESAFIEVIPSGSDSNEATCDCKKLWVSARCVQLIAEAGDSTAENTHIILTLKNGTRYDLYNDVARKAGRHLGLTCCCGECIETRDEYAGEATSGC